MRERVLVRLREAAEAVVREIDAAALDRVAEVGLVASKSPEHGDFASNAALLLARPLGVRPRELAERLRAHLRDPEGILERVEIAGPGFLNFFVSDVRVREVLARVLAGGRDYGRRRADPSERVQVEFVSANPTGPLTIGHGRNAVLGDVIARLLEAQGHEVSREYYFNDAGRQMRVLGASLRARYLQALGREAALPEEGYQGEYLAEIAGKLVALHGAGWLDAPVERFRDAALEAIFEDIRGTLTRLGIHFDVYYNEHGLYEDGLVEQTLADLRARGHVYDEDGAVWLRGRGFGLDRDRVLVKSTGEPTYLLPDVAYHREKFRRGFERVIDVWGPDHIEQFPYVRAAAGALGCAPERIEVVIYQWVNLRRGSELVKMSTRQATFVSCDEVLDEVGGDAFRYFMVERRADTHLDFDIDLARERSERNPVYKIQYAHARLSSIERKARERGVEEVPFDAVDTGQLASPQEVELVKRLERYPDVVERAAQEREPQELARFLLDLATCFHTYVSDARRHRVISDEPALTAARLALCAAVRIVLSNGLELLGISAPERM